MKKKKIILCVFSLLLLLFAGGCGKKQKETDMGYRIYYVDENGIKLQDFRYVPRAETFEEVTEELTVQLSASLVSGTSALKNNVKIQGFQRGIDALRIDLSKEYYSLDNIEAVLLRAAVIKTFAQVPGVTQIMLTVDDEQITDSQGNPVPAMGAEAFIDTREGGINSYQYATLLLYFPSLDGTHLVQEKRSLDYSSNMVLENVVLEQLLGGPKAGGMAAAFTSDTLIQSVAVENGLCRIDLNAACEQVPAGWTTSFPAELAVYSLVNSLCQTCDGVDRVAISIDGDSDRLFRGSISLDRIFKLDLSYLQAADGQDYGTNGIFGTGNENTGS